MKLNYSVRFISCIVCFFIILYGCANILPSNDSKIIVNDQNNVSLENTIGEFVYYLDTRANKNALFGILYFAEGHYDIRYKDLNSNSEFVLEIKISHKNSDVIIEEIKIIKGNEEDKNINNVIVDILNLYSQYLRTDFTNFLSEVKQEDPWPEFGYTLIHTYKYWIPVFGLYETSLLKTSETNFKVLFIGKMRSRDDLTFFEFSGIPTIVKEGPKLILEQKNPNVILIDKINITIDDNWIEKKDLPTLPLPNVSYWIENETFRDSILFVENMDFDKYNIKGPYQFIKMVLLLSGNGYIDPKSVIIDEFENKIYLEYNILDYKTNGYTKSILLFFHFKNNTYKILNFNAFLSTYESNKEYFKNILKSVILEHE